VKIQGKVFVISGPSGSGKTTLRDRVLAKKRIKREFVKSVSFTTRKKRSGERNGKDYFFISRSLFKRHLKEQKILEWTRYLGYYYATSREFVARQLQSGKNIVLCLDLKGARRVKKLFSGNAVTIFVKPPSLKELRSRIEGRCNRTKKAEVLKRMALARKELRAASEFDYRLTNNNLARAVNRLEVIILKELSFNKGEGY
jgi:guanylate kinase